MVGDEVGDHLGVGLGGEPRAHVGELLLELDVVLDDPVDDDVHAIGGVEVRMGVLLGDAAVGRPPRVADAGLRPFGDRDGSGGAVTSATSPTLSPRASSAARSALRLPTARTASIRSPSSTEIPALS